MLGQVGVAPWKEYTISKHANFWMNQVRVICHILPYFDRTYTVSVTGVGSRDKLGKIDKVNRRVMYSWHFFVLKCVSWPMRQEFSVNRGLSCLSTSERLASVVPAAGCTCKTGNFTVGSGGKTKVWMTNCGWNYLMQCWNCACLSRSSCCFNFFNNCHKCLLCFLKCAKSCRVRQVEY